MSTQYDQLSQLYDELNHLPGQVILPQNIHAALGNISSYDVLDLACGTGFYSNLLIDWGAARVLGIDISPEMIREAKTKLHPDRAGRIEYRVGDCTAPELLQSLGITDDRQFDLVHGAWLLNYAAMADELTSMWHNIASNLKPGGRFVGIIPNLEAGVSFEKPFGNPKYGITTRAVEKVEHGHKVRVTAHVAACVEFENYILDQDHVYTRSAATAGMLDVTWKAVGPFPEDIERMEPGFWDEFVARPFSAVCTAVREQ